MCNVITKTGTQCTRPLAKTSQRYCAGHAKLYEQYTDEEYQNMPICKTCKMKFVPSKSASDECEKCHRHNINRRANQKNKFSKCAHEGCTGSTKNSDNQFCLKHQRDLIKLQADESGKIPCRNWNRGCKNLIDPNGTRKSCINCPHNKDTKSHNIESIEQPSQVLTQPMDIIIDNDSSDLIEDTAAKCSAFRVELSLDQHGTPLYDEPGIIAYFICQLDKSENSQYCEIHKWLEQFSEEEWPHIRKCNKCTCFINPKKTGRRNCDNCQINVQAANQRAKELRQLAEKCIFFDPYKNGEKCVNRKSPGSEYCNLPGHCKLIGKDPNKLCCNFVYGCLNEKPSDENICQMCSELDQVFRTKYPSIPDEKKGNCKKCHRLYKMYYIQHEEESSKCQYCFEMMLKGDANRNPRVRDWAREYANMSDEQKQRKVEYRAFRKLHYPDIIRAYWVRYRLKMRLELGESEYKHLQAEKMRLYRSQRIEEVNYYSYNNPYTKLNSYKLSAKAKCVEWKLSDNKAIAMFHMPCFYCGWLDKSHKILNGIDKIEYDGQYDDGNVVPACKTCNLMKICLDFHVFILRCIHIANFMTNDPDINLNFPNTSYDVKNNCSYNTYKSSALSRKRLFEITEEQYHEIRSRPCYICGKYNSNTHQNGIDRIDSLIGYLYENCDACCGSCNYMKGDLSLGEFLNKCHLISCMYKDVLEQYEDLDAVMGGKNIKKRSIKIQHHSKPIDHETKCDTDQDNDSKQFSMDELVTAKIAELNSLAIIKAQKQLVLEAIKDDVSSQDIIAQHKDLAHTILRSVGLKIKESTDSSITSQFGNELHLLNNQL